MRAVEDPSLVEELAPPGMPLEVCPTSNVCLGVVPRAREPLLRPPLRAGVALSVNSDDPAFFNTNLTREYLRLHQTFGYTSVELAGLVLGALRQSFLPEDRRAALEEGFLRQFDALGRELFGAPVEAPVT